MKLHIRSHLNNNTSCIVTGAIKASKFPTGYYYSRVEVL